MRLGVQVEIVVKSLNKQRRAVLHHAPIQIGRQDDACVRLQGWRVGTRHASLYVEGEQLFIEDQGSLQGTLVNNQRVKYYGPVRPDDQIVIGPYRLRVRVLANDSQKQNADAICQQAMHQNGDQESGMQEGQDSNQRETLESAHENGSFASDDLSFSSAYDWYKTHLSQINALKTQVLQKINLREMVAAESGQESVKNRIRNLALQTLTEQEPTLIEQPRAGHAYEQLPSAQRLNEAAKAGQDYAGQMAKQSADLAAQRLVDFVLADICGLGLLEPILHDEAVTEIMVNGLEGIFVERQGVCERLPVHFKEESDLRHIIERIVAPLGRRVDESMPMVDARLQDGSRVHIILPPVALNGPIVTIRKFSQRLRGWQDLIDNGTLNVELALELQKKVREKKNMLISGGTGSGKTTLLNILSSSIPQQERIVTIEDAAELRLHHPNLVRLESRPANAEGVGEISIRELLRNALRMRPDRIIVGECRGSEAFDMLTAMNTGHEGSLSTLHANSPREAVHRLESLVLMAEVGLPFKTVRDYIAMSIDYVVQIERLDDGRRRISEVSAITGMEGEVIQMERCY